MMDEPAALSDIGHHDSWQEPPRWPKPVGIISIVWGALGLTCAGCGVASFFMTNLMSGMIPPEMGPMPAVMQPGAAQLGLQAVGLLWAVLLIVAGIMVVNRNPAGRGLHLLYAVGAILMTIVGVVLAVQQQNAIAAWAAQNPDSPWAKQSSPTVAYIILGIFVLLGLIWPIFCLVWFGLVKRRPEDFTGGDLPAA